MEACRIAAAQINSRKDDLEGNIATHARIIQQASQAGCDLVVFPETSVTSHYVDASAGALRHAEEAGAGPVFRRMRELAETHRVTVGFGFAERAAGTFFNSYALVGPSGVLGVQRKLVASGDENTVFSVGRELTICRTSRCCLGVLICYDAAFSEHWRLAALRGAEVVIQPSAGRRGGKGREVPAEEQRDRLRGKLDSMPGPLGTYAAENGVYVVHCNQIGYNGHSTHNGGACIVGPRGELIARSDPVLEDIWISAQIDPAPLEEARRHHNYTLKNRRPELYEELAWKMRPAGDGAGGAAGAGDDYPCSGP